MQGVLRRVLVLILLVSGAPVRAAPLATGRLDYRLSWNGIAAATATVNVTRDDQGQAPRYRVEWVTSGEETITVTAGTFPAWRVEPRVWKIGTGVDQRLRRATLWVSQEPVRTLLRIRSEVFIGAVNCDLQRLAPPLPM